MFIYFSVWFSVIYVYKGFMLVFGVFMVWEIRNVMFVVLNDLCYIGIFVYNVVFLCVLGMMVVNVVDYYLDVIFVVLFVFVVFCIIIMFCFVFFLKVIICFLISFLL